jgi:hypothetical protein
MLLEVLVYSKRRFLWRGRKVNAIIVYLEGDNPLEASSAKSFEFKKTEADSVSKEKGCILRVENLKHYRKIGYAITDTSKVIGKE